MYQKKNEAPRVYATDDGLPRPLIALLPATIFASLVLLVVFVPVYLIGSILNLLDKKILAPWDAWNGMVFGSFDGWHESAQVRFRPVHVRICSYFILPSIPIGEVYRARYGKDAS